MHMVRKKPVVIIKKKTKTSVPDLYSSVCGLKADPPMT